MSEWIEAIFENGAFHPQTPVQVAEGERVSLHVEPVYAAADELSDVRDMLDLDYLEFCRQSTEQPPSLAEVRTMLARFQGSLADLISEERDEH